jgi:chorismate mutase
MDNRINEIRRKISSLRARMLDVESSIRVLVNKDGDCTESALRLMAMRTEMVELLQQRKAAGGDDRCPTVEERLKENYRAPEKRTNPVRGPRTSR